MLCNAFYRFLKVRKHAERNNLLKRPMPLFKRHKDELEHFDDVREVLNDPFNDKLKFAIRHENEQPSIFLPPNQIDELYSIFQTSEQRVMMSECTILFIDQNDEVTPEGAARTLTIGGLYKGNIILTFSLLCQLVSSVDPHISVYFIR